LLQLESETLFVMVATVGPRKPKRLVLTKFPSASFFGRESLGVDLLDEMGLILFSESWEAALLPPRLPALSKIGVDVLVAAVGIADAERRLKPNSVAWPRVYGVDRFANSLFSP
jgi:ABC-type amino acid transport substrate-binding protein